MPLPSRLIEDLKLKECSRDIVIQRINPYRPIRSCDAVVKFASREMVTVVNVYCSVSLPVKKLGPADYACIAYELFKMIKLAKQCHDGDRRACEEQACQQLMTVPRWGCPEDFPPGHAPPPIHWF